MICLDVLNFVGYISNEFGFNICTFLHANLGCGARVAGRCHTLVRSNSRRRKRLLEYVPLWQLVLRERRRVQLLVELLHTG